MMRVLLIVLTVLLTGLKDEDRAELRGQNYLPNPGCERGTAGFTATGSSVLQTDTIMFKGTQSCNWNASAAVEEFQWETVAGLNIQQPNGVPSSVRCEASFWYRWNGGTAGHLIFEVEDGNGDALIEDVTLTATNGGVWRQVKKTFQCPSTFAIQARIRATADAVDIRIDDMWLGPWTDSTATTSNVVYELTSTVGTVGNAGQIAAGHTLTSSSFPSSLISTSALAFWYLNTDTLDDSSEASCSGACNFTNTGATFTDTDLFGAASNSITFDGTDHLDAPSNAFFDPDTKSFSFFTWVNAVYNTTGDRFIGTRQDGGSQRSWTLYLSGNNILKWSLSNTAGSEDFNSFYSFPYADNTWVHVGIVYDNSLDRGRLYINGRPAEDSSAVTNVRTPATGNFIVGATNSSSPTSFYTGSMSMMVYANVALTDEEVYKLYNYKHPHNKNIQASDQQWLGNYSNGNDNPMDNGWILHKEVNNIYWDFSDLQSTDTVNLKLLDQAVSSHIGQIAAYDQVFTSDPCSGGDCEISTGQPGTIRGLEIWYEFATDEWKKEVTDSFCHANDATTLGNIDCNFSSLTIAAGSRLRIIATSSGPVAISINDTSLTRDGLVYQDTMSEALTVNSGTSMIYPILDMTGGGSVEVSGTLFSNEIIGGTLTGTGEVTGL